MRHAWKALAGILLLAAMPSFAQDKVEIKLGATNTESGITLKEPEGYATTVDSGGRKSNGLMYFDVSDAYALNGSKPIQWVTVEYLDKGTDQFRLEYDGVDDANDATDDTVRGAQGGMALAKYDTGQWLTYTFALTDANFGNLQEGGADFRINDMTMAWDAVYEEWTPVEGEAPEIIRSITITSTEPVPYHISYAKTPVKVDGVLDDEVWATAQVFEVNRAAQDVIRPSAWTGVEDYSLKGKFAWDPNYFYLGYDVVDDVPRVHADDPGTAWMGDGTEVYIGFDQTKPSRTAYIPGQDFQVVVTAGPNPNWGIFSQGASIWTDEDREKWIASEHVKVVDTANGYILEARIPWAMMKDADGKEHAGPVPGQRIGFNIFANDGDNPDSPNQEVAMGFTERPGAWGNPSAWTTAVVDPPASVVKSGDMNNDGKINVQDATLSLRIAVGLLTPTDAQKEAGDVNNDNKLNIQDTTLILQVAVGNKPASDLK